MAKIKGWTKVRYGVWRKDVPTFGKGGRLHEVVSVNGWNVKVADAVSYNPSAMELHNNSYVISTHTSHKRATDSAIKFMREQTR